MRENGYGSEILAEADFEIDNNGQPHMIFAKLEPQVGLGGKVPEGLITVNAMSGEIHDYKMSEVPLWVDIVVPQELVESTVDYWGTYVNGFWNTVWGNKGVRKPTPGEINVYSKGRTYWYVGIQSSSSDGSTSGFMLIDSRTMKAKEYKKSGITETVAMSIAEAEEVVKAARYYATHPVPYNVRGMFSYFMTLKDASSGEVKMYAFVSVSNRNMVGVGKSPKEAEVNYLKSIMRASNSQIKDGPIEKKTMRLTIKDITHEGNTYFILFDGIKGKEFSGSSEFFKELKWSKPRQQVDVSFGDGAEELIPLDFFDNINVEI